MILSAEKLFQNFVIIFIKLILTTKLVKIQSLLFIFVYEYELIINSLKPYKSFHVNSTRHREKIVNFGKGLLEQLPKIVGKVVKFGKFSQRKWHILSNNYRKKKNLEFW